MKFFIDLQFMHFDDQSVPSKNDVVMKWTGPSSEYSYYVIKKIYKLLKTNILLFFTIYNFKRRTKISFTSWTVMQDLWCLGCCLGYSTSAVVFWKGYCHKKQKQNSLVNSRCSCQDLRPVKSAPLLTPLYYLEQSYNWLSECWFVSLHDWLHWFYLYSLASLLLSIKWIVWCSF